MSGRRLACRVRARSGRGSSVEGTETRWELRCSRSSACARLGSYKPTRPRGAADHALMGRPAPRGLSLSVARPWCARTRAYMRARVRMCAPACASVDTSWIFRETVRCMTLDFITRIPSSFKDKDAPPHHYHYHYFLIITYYLLTITVNYTITLYTIIIIIICSDFQI